MTVQHLPEELYLYTLHLPEDVEDIFLHDQPFLAETLTEFGLVRPKLPRVCPL